MVKKLEMKFREGFYYAKRRKIHFLNRFSGLSRGINHSDSLSIVRNRFSRFKSEITSFWNWTLILVKVKSLRAVEGHNGGLSWCCGFVSAWRGFGTAIKWPDPYTHKKSDPDYTYLSKWKPISALRLNAGFGSIVRRIVTVSTVRKVQVVV
jgi:hypothetical protein